MHATAERIPGVLVDCVVLASCRKPCADLRHGRITTLILGASACRSIAFPPLPLDERKIIARRCAFELPPGGVVNLGIGMPEGVAAVAAEERVLRLSHAHRRTWALSAACSKVKTSSVHIETNTLRAKPQARVT